MPRNRSHVKAKFIVRPDDPFHSKSPAMIDFNVTNNVNWKNIDVYDKEDDEWNEKDYHGNLAFIENKNVRNTDIDNVEIDLNTDKNVNLDKLADEGFPYFTPYTLRDLMVDNYIQNDKSLGFDMNVLRAIIAVQRRSHERGKAFGAMENAFAGLIGRSIESGKFEFPKLNKFGEPCKKEPSKTCCKLLDSRMICSCDPGSSAIILRDPQPGMDPLESLQKSLAKGTDFVPLDRIPRCVQDFKKLENVTISGNRLEKIENLDGLKKLSFLDLRANPEGYSKIKTLENVDELENLKVLVLRDNRITRIENLESNQNLEIIDLTKNDFTTPDGLEILEKLPKLRKIQLGGNEFTGDEKLLQAFTKALESLDMKHPAFVFTT